MKTIILTENPQNYTAYNDACKVIDLKTIDKPIPDSWKNYSEEYIPYLICEHLKTQEPFLIFIDLTINKSYIFFLAHHLLTSLNTRICFISETDTAFSLHENSFGIFLNKGLKIINSERLCELIDSNTSELTRFGAIYDDNFDYDTYISNYQKFLDLDRHQATNEWGAIKLLLNYGLSLKTIEKSYQIPKTIFFKQKLIEHKITDTSIIDFTGYPDNTGFITAKRDFTTNSRKLNRILLIDDNAEKGWEFALSQLFKSATIDVKTNFDDSLKIPDLSLYDFIFLDLRLPLNSASDKTPDPENGYRLISLIKQTEHSLHIPLVVFTASQKASTLNKILKAGADAMYVKESVEYTKIESYENLYGFISVINLQINKGVHLKKYWQAIIKIKSSLLPEIIDTTLLLKSRIIERLEMFYGLIKQQYEQSDYNNNTFHYSADILSFMTLWSILNEIQECYFDKNLGTSQIRIGRGTPNIIPLDDWKLKNQVPDKYFIVEKPLFAEEVNSSGQRLMPHNRDIKTDTYSNFQIKHTPPYYEIDRQGFKIRRVNYREKLSLQIAFILIAKNTFNSSHQLTTFLVNLNASNKQRNKLYLTHGENSSTGFHNFCEKDKSLAPNSTLNLFKLISFLLTGNDTII